MNQINEEAIVLARTNFGEADRILTVLTKSHGKVRLMAKGVRRVKSKLAGGIELFSTTQVSYIVGRGEIHTLISTRLIKFYSNISQNIERTMYGYEVLKLVSRVTEDGAGEEYFNVLTHALDGLNDDKLQLNLIKLWITLQLLKLDGHSPNLDTDTVGEKLNEKTKYTFDLDDMNFAPSTNGKYNSRHIKLMRLAINMSSPIKLQTISDVNSVLADCIQISESMLKQFTK